MNYIYLALLTVLPLLPLHAQTIYGNEWVNPEQQYLRLGITETGWYRLNASDLQKQGMDISTLTAQSLRLFRRGQEVSIYVRGEEDGSLNSSDYIEFYGERNDGYLDTLLYDSRGLMPHPHYSLYSDTAIYFLTWSPTITTIKGKRIRQVASPSLSATATYHQEQVLHVFTREYPAGAIYPLGAWYDDGYILTPYDVGEGWTGPTIGTNQWGITGIQALDPVRGRMDEASIEILFVGRYAGPHQVEVWVGNSTKQSRKLGGIQWDDYATAQFRATLLPGDLSSNDSITIAYKNLTNTSFSASYARWTYPQKIQFAGIVNQKILYPPKETSLRVDTTTDLRWFDVSNPSLPQQLVPIIKGGESTISPVGTHKLLVVKNPLSVTNIRSMRFRTIDTIRTNYLIITHPLVRKAVQSSVDPVADYATYRASTQGGSYVPLVMNMAEVADQFNYGEPGPHGTRKLMQWLHDRGSLRFTFLIGRSRSPQIVRQRTTARDEDMVPSAGWPDSDIALGMGLDPLNPNVPIVPIGRLNAYTSQNVWDYLQKIKQHEAVNLVAPWRKNILHLSGGRSSRELITYRNFIDQFAATLNPSSVGPSIRTLSKQTDEPVERFDIASQINGGVALMTLFGHSSLNITDIDIGFASNNALGYRNQGRYPAVLVNGCALGNFYFGPPPISTDWILTPNRGAILFLAHTHNGLQAGMYRYSSSFYEVLADPAFTSRPFGDIMREGIRRYVRLNKGLSDRATAQQMNLQGDPAVVIFPATKPDYTWKIPSVRITNTSGGATITTWDDSLRISAEIANYGRFTGGTYSISIQRKDGAQVLANYSLTRKAVPFTDSLRITLPNGSRQAGEESWEFVIDPTNEVHEEDETNNSLTQTIRISEGGVIPLLPADKAIVNSPTIELIAQVPAGRVGQRVVFEQSNDLMFAHDTKRDTVVASTILVKKLLQLTNTGPQTLYWRVYIVGDSAVTVRRFQYDKTNITPYTSLPEGVASILTSYPKKVEEGGMFTATITFENIASVAFQDSIEVLVQATGERYSTILRFKILPLEAQSTYTFQFNTSTLRKAGQNRAVIYFNASQLPEEFYGNNRVELRYEVLPDRVPPVLDVTIENQRLRDLDVVSPQPTIQIKLRDDNPYLLRSDTTDLKVRLLADCNGCSDIRIGLENAQWSRIPTSEFNLELALPTLSTGTYRLTVEGKDVAQNAAAPYQIRFRVTDIPRVIRATASPNPARYWVKFELKLEGKIAPENWIIQLFSLDGKLVKTLQLEPHLGTNETFWFPVEIAPGLYLYKMTLQGGEWNDMGAGSGRIILSP